MQIEKVNQNILLPGLEEFVRTHLLDFSGISEERKAGLAKIAEYIRENRSDGDSTLLTFICTHNSRRSHMSQLWASAAAAFYGIGNILCYSGGTESTAFNPRAVKAMQNAGFEIVKTEDSDNPLYEVIYSASQSPISAFSKKFSDPFNPQEGFAAIMTCSDADEACPFVPGAEARFSMPYEDPKASDNTPLEEETYFARCRQIGTEMFYLMSLI